MLGMGKLAYLRIKVIMIVAILIVGFSSMSAIPISLPPAYAQTTFGSIVNLSNNAGPSFNAQVATLGNNVYITWTDETPGNQDIFFRKSTDGGATFGSAQQLTSTPGQSCCSSIAVAQVGGNTHVYIAYQEMPLGGTSLDSEVFLLRSTDDGATFGAPVNISNTLGSGSGSAYVAAASNFVFVAWSEAPSPGFPNSEIFLRRSIDAGVNFQSSVQMSNTGFFSFTPRIALNLPNVHIVWGDNGNGAVAVGGLGETLYRRSTDNGITYEPVVNLSSNTDFSLGPDIAASGSNVHVAWAEHTSSNVPTQVVYKRSTTNGASFGATTTLFTLSGVGSQTASTGIAATGSNVFLVFNDVSGGNQEIFFMKSSNIGGTFSSAVNISNNSGESNFADIAVSSVHVTWHDNTPTNFDIFTTTGATGTQVTGSVTIAGTCGLAPVSGSPINYGTLTPFSISPEQTLVLDNTGSVSATLSVKGTDWLDSGTPPTAQMLVGNTKFATTALVSYATKTALTTIDQTVGPILPITNLNTFWQLQANLLSTSFAGSLTQTMDFTVSC